MANTIAVSVIGDVRDINQKLGQVDSKLGSFGKKLGNFKNVLAGAFAGTAVIAGVKSVIDSASNLNETVSKTQQVFGKSAPAIQAWASTAATSLGMSTQAALDGASQFGNLFDQLGIGKKKSEDMSKSLVQMSSDLGSFNNADPSQVMEAFTSATRGEYDALQRFIPTVNAATVEAEALKNTHKKSAKELTAADKAQALYTLSQKTMGKAAGDFARTQGGAANQQRILNAQLEDAKAKIGQGLLPIFTKVVTFITGSLIPAFGQFGGWLQKNQAWVKPLAVGIGAIVAAIGAWVAISKVFAVVQAAVNIVLAANPIGIVVLAIVGLVAALVYAWKNSKTFRAVVTGAWNAIKTVAVTVFTTVKNFIVAAFQFIKNAFFKFTILGLVISHFGRIKAFIVGAWNTVKSATSTAWNAIKRTVSGVVSSVISTVSGIKAKVVSVMSGAGSWLLSAGRNIVQGLINGAKAMVGNLISNIKGIASSAIEAAKSVLKINSPSKVFAEIGKGVGEGLIVGIDRMGGKVSTASASLAKDVANGFSAPELALNASGSGASGNTYNITVEAPVGSSSADIGRTIVKHIDAYERLGGRRAS